MSDAVNSRDKNILMLFVIQTDPNWSLSSQERYKCARIGFHSGGCAAYLLSFRSPRPLSVNLYVSLKKALSKLLTPLRHPICQHDGCLPLPPWYSHPCRYKLDLMHVYLATSPPTVLGLPSWLVYSTTHYSPSSSALPSGQRISPTLMRQRHPVSIRERFKRNRRGIPRWDWP